MSQELNEYFLEYVRSRPTFKECTPEEMTKLVAFAREAQLLLQDTVMEIAQRFSKLDISFSYISTTIGLAMGRELFDIMATDAAAGIPVMNSVEALQDTLNLLLTNKLVARVQSIQQEVGVAQEEATIESRVVPSDVLEKFQSGEKQ